MCKCYDEKLIMEYYNTYKNDSLEKLNEALFFNAMEDTWFTDNYAMDEALTRLIKEKTKNENISE